MRLEELQEGVNQNNAKVMDPAAWRLRWISASLVPTGTVFSFQFQIPSAAQEYRLEYLLAAWPVSGGVYRPLFCEIDDDRGQKHVLTGQRPETQLGMAFHLFTTPGTSIDPAAAGTQSAYKGAMPLNLRFPGRATVTLNIRGALATPNPTTLKILIMGHQKNQAG